jgi:hypothetical protein
MLNSTKLLNFSFLLMNIASFLKKMSIKILLNFLHPLTKGQETDLAVYQKVR